MAHIKLKTLISEKILKFLGESSLLFEGNRFDTNKIEGAVEYIIRQVWHQMPPGEDKFSNHQLIGGTKNQTFGE